MAKMMKTRDGPYSLPEREGDANYAIQTEFVCFMAKRVNKKKAATGEKVYRIETPDMQRKLRESRNKEWNSWKKYQAVRQFACYKPIPTRWADLGKNEKLRATNKDVEEKLKSRLVMRGDLEEGSFRGNCPTVSTLGLHLLVSNTALRGLFLKSGDISAAFLQGAPLTRIVILRAPAEGVPGDDFETQEMDTGAYMIAAMAIYGARDAPRGFWLSLKDEVVSQPEVHEVTGEPALYAVTANGHLHGYKATHVEDVLWNSDPIVNEDERRHHWYQISLRSTSFSVLRRRQVKMGSCLAKNYLEFSECVILSITDASHAAELHVGGDGREKGYRSQGGRMLCLADKMPTVAAPAKVHLLEWSSTIPILKRAVCRSTLQAETLSSMRGSESAQHLRAAMLGPIEPKPPGRDEPWTTKAYDYKEICWLTDCRSLVGYMSSTTVSTVSDKRLAIDLTTLLQELSRPCGTLVGDPASQPGMPLNAKERCIGSANVTWCAAP
eukprot:s856_g13.t1